MSKEPKRYNIQGFEQLFNVLTEENFERLMMDFMLAAGVYITYIKETRKDHPQETEGKDNWDILKYHFQWIDDGKHDMKSITVTNPRTGETKTKKL